MSKQFEAVTIPKWGIEMTHGRIVEWHYAEGARISAGVELVDIETDKIVNSFEARASGTLARILIPEGEELSVGTLIGVIALTDFSSDELETFIARQVGPESLRVSSSDTDQQTKDADDADLISDENAKSISPALLRKLSKAGVDPAHLVGSGPNGRILKQDVDRALAQDSAVKPTDTEGQTLSASQKKVAAALSYAQATVPIYYVRRKLRVGAALAKLKAQLPDESGVLTTLLVRAVAKALAEHPLLNIQLDGETIQAVNGLNVALAVARDDGAVSAPVVTNVDQRSDLEVSQTITALVSRARAGRLVADDMQSAAITISNLGMYGVDDFTAMVTPPQIMVLSVGRLTIQPSWDVVTQHFISEEQVTVTLGSDHRLINGAQAAQWLQTLAVIIEETWVALPTIKDMD